MRVELRKIQASIDAANERIGKLDPQLEKTKEDKRKAERCGRERGE